MHRPYENENENRMMLKYTVPAALCLQTAWKDAPLNDAQVNHAQPINSLQIHANIFQIYTEQILGAAVSSRLIITR